MSFSGDIVQQALAQLAGGPSKPGSLPLAPVAFSPAWIPYAVRALAAAAGSNRLMPPASDAAPAPLLLNARSGHTRPVHSWLLARLYRDHCIRARTGAGRAPAAGLRVSFCRTAAARAPGAEKDAVYLLALGALYAQLALAALPLATHGRAAPLCVTAAGTLAALLHGARARWRAEKWCARALAPRRREAVCLAGGAGSAAVLVLLNDAPGVRLEDLAAGRACAGDPPLDLVAALALLLFALAYAAALCAGGGGMGYARAAGVLGLLQNAWAAGAVRAPAAVGLPLEDAGEVWREKVFDALVAAEAVERGVGLGLLRVFFAGGLRDDEEAWRVGRLQQYAVERALEEHEG